MEGLDARLWNWARWLMERESRQAACGSFEGIFRSRQSKIWHAPGPRPIEAKAADAWDLELAMATLKIRPHLVLELKYLWRMTDARIAELCRVCCRDRTRERDIEEIEWEAKLDLCVALSQPVVIRRTRAVERARGMIRQTLDLMVD